MDRASIFLVEFNDYLRRFCISLLHDVGDSSLVEHRDTLLEHGWKPAVDSDVRELVLRFVLHDGALCH